MGDRGNICMMMKNGGKVYFYTHWGGSSLKQILQSALKRGRNRWDDEPYLARIIFSEMIQDDVMDELGFGISTYLTDNENPIYYVNVSIQRIIVDDLDYSFEEFLTQ